MRKLSRLLAALLTVCLLCGMVLPFAALAAEGIDAKASTAVEYNYTVGSVEEFNALTLKSGDVVKVTASIEGALPVADATGLVNFKVVCDEGATFALSEEANFTVSQSDNTYYCVTKGGITSASQLNKTNDSWNFYNNFNGINSKFVGAPSDNDGGHIAGTKGDSASGYIRIYKDDNPSKTPNASNAGFVWTASTYNWSDNDNYLHMVGNYNYASYAVIDYDFGTDRYWYTSGDTYKTTTDLSEAKTGDAYGIAIPDGMWFGVMNRNIKYGADGQIAHATDASVNSKNNVTFGYICKGEDGLFYYCSSSTLESSNVKIPLSSNGDNIGLTDHITTVVSTLKNADGKITDVKYNVYVNGQFLVTKYTTLDVTGTSGKVNSVSFHGVLFSIPGAVKTTDSYSVMVDNLAVNWYREDVVFEDSNNDDKIDYMPTSWKEYNSGDAIVGIDDFVNGDVADLVGCQDTVFGAAYKVPTDTNGYWYSNDGFKTVTFYPEIGWNSGDTILTNDPALSLSGDYTHFTVEYVGNGNFDASALTDSYDAYNYDGKNIFIKKAGADVAADALKTTTHQWNEIQQFDGTAGATFGGTDSTNNKGLSSATANGYWQITTNTANTGINAYQVLQANVYGANSTANYYTTSITDSDYVTVDFDFGTDVNGGLQSGMQVGFYLMSGDSVVEPKCYIKKGLQTAAYVVEKNGQLYLSNSSSYNASAVPLSNVAGESYHITTVFALNEAGTNYDLHTYVNGQSIGKVSVNAGYNLGTKKSCATHSKESVADSLVVRGLTFYVPAASNNANLSVMVDNVAYNRYATGYKSADYVGVDDVVAGTNKLTEAEDVIYNYTYATADSKWYTADNFKTVAFIPEYKWNSGDTVITNATEISALSKYERITIKNVEGSAIDFGLGAQNDYAIIEMHAGEYLAISKGADIVSTDLTTTNHIWNFANAFDGKATAAGVKGQHDSSYIKGVDLSTSGYLRLFNDYDAVPYKAPGDAGFVWTMSNSTGTTANAEYDKYDLYDANYIVLDYDFGADRYSFSYTANATSTTKQILAITGVPIAADGKEGKEFDAATEYQEKYADAYAKLLETSTLSGKTYYKTVSTVADYEAYKANVSSLLAAEKDIIPNYRDLIVETRDNGDGTKTRYKIAIYKQDVLTEVVAVNNDLNLALSEGMSFGVYGWYALNKANGDGSFSIDTEKSGTGRINDIIFQLIERDGKFYFSTDSKYSADDVAASNAVGTTDHITIVMDTVTKANTVTYHVYINGVFFTSTETNTPLGLKAGGVANFKYQGARFGVPEAIKHTDSYSMMIDNIATNWYDGTTVGTSDIAALVADTSKNVYDVNNVVYAKDYIAPGAKWATTDNFETLTYIPSLYAEGLTEGGTIVTNANLYNFKPTVDKFTFDGRDGAEMSVMASYIAKDNGDGTYTYEKFNAGTIANLDLANKGMTFNLYLPEIKDASVFANGAVAELSVYDGEYTALTGANYYSWTGSISSFASQTIIVSGKYTVAGVDYDVTFPVTLDVVKYATILADISEKDSVNANLAKEIVDYKKAIYKYVNGSIDASAVASLVEFDKVNKSEGITVDSFTATGASVEGMSYVLKNDGTADLYITAEKGDDIVVKFADANLAAAQPTVGKVGYSEENGYYVISGIRAAFIDDAISVSITYEDEAKTDISATYCLIDYLAAQTDAAVIEMGKALVAYAQACEAFVVGK